jgi:hypothetical protein
MLGIDEKRRRNIGGLGIFKFGGLLRSCANVYGWLRTMLRCEQGNGCLLKMQLKSLKVASNLTKGGLWVNKALAYLASHCSYIWRLEFVMKIVDLLISKTVD